MEHADPPACRNVTPGRRKICIVTASVLTVRAFLMDQIATLAAAHDVTVITHRPDGNVAVELDSLARVLPLPFSRDIAPLADLASLRGLLRIFQRERFDILHTVTPKAGLLGQIAGFVQRIPVRIHVFTGQAWVTRRGFWRIVLKSIDRLIAALATHIIVDSPSQRDFLVAHGIVRKDRAEVLLRGSISGVDTNRFRPDPDARSRLRNALDIAADSVVFLYVGRLNIDKGLLDLARACADPRLAGTVTLIVGPDEQNMRPQMAALCGSAGTRLIFVDYTDAPQDYMAAADVFCLPSYREGFGTVVIEAAACGVPAIASDIYGVRDAVADGKTGLLHPARDAAAIGTCMRRLASDAELRQQLGHAARERARADFSTAIITRALIEYYQRLPI
jgi:glycosyltransferase involved in cell wall biosynthesis